MAFRNSIKAFILFFFSLIIFYACRPNENEPDFDKSSLLKNISSEIILPSLNEFEESMNDLLLSFNTFSNELTYENLEAVRGNFSTTYVNWQYLKIYDFGPIKNYGLKSSIGSFPSDTAVICSNIQNGYFNLSALENSQAIGLSALDFLLYQENSIEYFQTDTNYLNYTYEVIIKIKNDFDLVQNEWTSYVSTFNNATGTSSTSSFSELINSYCQDLELAKNAKLGIPIGKQSLGIPLPEYIEAKYSGFSLELLESNIEALHQIYNGLGRTNNANGIGLDDYLIQLDKIDLNENIDATFGSISSQIQILENSLEEEILVNPQALDEIYFQLQELVILIKTDMTSSFGVLITYQDNDGD